VTLHLNQVLLHCTDVARSIAFYQGLGLTLIVRKAADGVDVYARFIVPGNQATLSLMLDAHAAPSGVEIAFECEDLDHRVAQLEGAGYVFDSEPEDKPYLWREAHLRDPDGHHLMLFWAGVNRRDPPWRLPESK
jgi:catechol 2,3-dioxygenase-like lactoylglutathione lyase family enzyme